MTSSQIRRRPRLDCFYLEGGNRTPAHSEALRPEGPGRPRPSVPTTQAPRPRAPSPQGCSGPEPAAPHEPRSARSGFPPAGQPFLPAPRSASTPRALAVCGCGSSGCHGDGHGGGETSERGGRVPGGSGARPRRRGRAYARRGRGGGTRAQPGGRGACREPGAASSEGRRRAAPSAVAPAVAASRDSGFVASRSRTHLS